MTKILLFSGELTNMKAKITKNRKNAHIQKSKGEEESTYIFLILCINTIKWTQQFL
jgi:hypothetical protein